MKTTDQMLARILVAMLILPTSLSAQAAEPANRGVPDWHLSIQYLGVTYHPDGGNTPEVYPLKLDRKAYLVLDVGAAVSLDYRLSDTSRSWWVANGYLQRFDSCVVWEIFGRLRAVFLVSAYRPDDTSLYAQRVLIDSIGYYTSYFYGLIDGTPPPFLHEARIGGVLFSTSTGVNSAEENLPSGFLLEQNYPNPFNPSTIVRYQLPKSALVNMTVYDILGRRVSVLVNERKNAGVHEVRFDATGLSSSVYFYRLTAGSYVETRKLVLMK